MSGLHHFTYFYEKNILKSMADAIVIPVNCVGVAGAGLAKAAVNEFPSMLPKYREYCARKMLEPGTLQLITDPRKIILFPTKIHWKNKSRREWVISGLDTLRSQEAMYSSIAIPPIGCGLGGLDWGDIRQYIEKVFSDSMCEIHLYCPAE